MKASTPLSPVIAAKMLGKYGVTPKNVVAATAAMTPEEAEATRQNIGADTPETVTEWLNNHVDPDTGYVIDNSLTIQGAAADAKKVGSEIYNLKNATSTLLEIPIMNGAGYYISSGSLVKTTNSARAYSDKRRCFKGEKLFVQVNKNYTFYVHANTNNVWSQKTNPGLTEGTYTIEFNNECEFAIVVTASATIPDGTVTARAFLLGTLELDNIRDNAENPKSAALISSDFVQGSLYNGNLDTTATKAISTGNYIPIKEPNEGIITIADKDSTGSWKFRASFFTSAKSFISQTSYDYHDLVVMPSNAKYYKLSLQKFVSGSSIDITPSSLTDDTIIVGIPVKLRKFDDALEPVFEDMPKISKFFATSEISFENGKFYNITDHKIDVDANYSLVKINVAAFRGGKIKGQTGVAPNSRYGVGFTDKNDGFIIGHSSANTGHYEFNYNLDVPDNAAFFYLSCRNASKDIWVDPTYEWEAVLQNVATNGTTATDVVNEKVCTRLLNAQHVKSGDRAPITILHFSDLHADQNALSRILKYAKTYGAKVDDIICTGDMVAGSYEQIDSWWPENVMTCIGNHDSASYSGGTYNWTALSMANRDAYYIAPFESAWGITHTSGTSYYYKDYTTQKVRLIVMDGMLYLDNGDEAAAQTTWLETLLADAITNSLHVLIAIHAPHGGAKAKDCSFSRFGQTDMPTLGDCNTPQSVVDAVATAITGGLHFVGYIVGHTHQDNVWDAENDGTQYMYCVTCAASTQTAQWVGSDMERNEQHDAFNLVTIDTSNTLVKIVRGGGADIDDHMRKREAICFNYSTGEIVGEL